MRENGVPLGLALNLWERMATWLDVIETVRAADELGYQVVVLPESFGRDGVSLCSQLLAATKHIHVCLGVANVFSRTPALLAQTAATLDDLSGGRFILGLATSTPNLIEGWHGVKYHRPLRTMRETIEICQRIWRGDRTPYEGEVFRTAGMKLAFAPVRERIPIWLGSLLPKSLELCGELGDGWLATLYPLDGLERGRARIAEGAAKAGRDLANITVAPTVNVAVTDEPDTARQMMKFGVMIYYGPPNSPYAKAAAPLGYAEDVKAVARAYEMGDRGAAVAAVSDRLADAVSIVGPLEDCRGRITQLLNDGADLAIIGMPAATRAACEPILAGLRPD